MILPHVSALPDTGHMDDGGNKAAILDRRREF
jgi:hypothetical protein